MPEATPKSSSTAPIRQWEGLPSQELRRIEILFCAPLNRELRYKGHNHSTARCGHMIGEIYRHVRLVNNQLPPQRHFGDDDFISRLFAGEYVRKRPQPDEWAKLRQVFETILRGDRLGNDSCSNAEADELRAKERIVTRMADYFFSLDEAGYARYFAPDILEVAAPQTAKEATYQLLWMANDVLRPGASGGLTLASGGPAFPFFEANGTLNEIGRAAATATACGIVLSFAFPSLAVCETAAFSTARNFLIEVNRRRENSKFPEWFAALAAKRTEDQIKRHREMMSTNVHLHSINPAIRKGPLWAGQFFNPTLRFTRIYHQPASADARPLGGAVVVPGTDGRPFAVQLNDSGKNAMTLWESAFLTAETRIELADLPIDHEVAPAVTSIDRSQKPRRKRRH